MKLIYLTLCLVIFAFVSTLFSACQVRGQEQSALFRQVFYGDSLHLPTEADTLSFRKVILGQEMASIKGLEMPFRPQHEDEFGLGYEIFLNEQSVLLLDYYSGRDANNRDRLVSIVADLILQDEVETARIYAELEAYLNNRYGLSDGSYEKQIWTAYTSFTNNMEVRLVLNENKRQIGLNLIDLQTAQTNPLFQTTDIDSLNNPQ